MGRVDAAAHPAAIEVPLPWGPVVRGLRWGAGTDSVLLLHEPGADLDSWGGLPARLAQTLGMATLAVDLPGHGLSDDPWEPEKLGHLLQLLVADHPSGRRFVVAAGDSGSSAMTLAGPLRLAGLVALSPTRLAELAPDARDELPPSPGSTGEGGRGVRANIPKLLFAGSRADADLEFARRLASTSAGWSAVTSVPVSARGTRLLATPWRGRIEEEIVAFLRDCQHRGPRARLGPRMPPPRPG